MRSKTISEEKHGIILRVFASGEEDLVVRALLSDGDKISAFLRKAKSEKSKRSIPEPLDHGILTLGILSSASSTQSSSENRTLLTLRSFHHGRSAPNLRQNLRGISLSLLVLEVFDKLCREGLSKRPEIFALLAATIAELEKLAEQSNRGAYLGANSQDTAPLFFRVVCESIWQLLATSGFLNISRIANKNPDYVPLLPMLVRCEKPFAPSPKMFYELIKQIEDVTQSKLASSAAAIDQLSSR